MCMHVRYIRVSRVSLVESMGLEELDRDHGFFSQVAVA